MVGVKIPATVKYAIPVNETFVHRKHKEYKSTFKEILNNNLKNIILGTK